MTAPQPEAIGASLADLDSSALLSARGLRCERDDRVLFDQLDFDIHCGEVVQLKGRNGSGKTTLLRILCGLNSAYIGEIYCLGEKVAEQPDEFRAMLSYLGHRVAVNKVLTPLENLRWASQLRGSVDELHLMEALREVGLRGFEYSQCYTLSAGQQQRVALARLMLSRARLWVLDEPFTTLDVDGVKQLEQRLEQHANEGGAVLVTTHHELRVVNARVLQLK